MNEFDENNGNPDENGELPQPEGMKENIQEDEPHGEVTDEEMSPDTQDVEPEAIGTEETLGDTITDGYESPSENYNFYSEDVHKKTKKRHGALIGAIAGVIAGILLTAAVGTTVLLKTGIIKKEDIMAKNTERNQDNSFEFSRLSGSQRKPKSVVDIAAEVGPSVVMVTTTSMVNTIFGSEQQEVSGSGIIINKDGYIITNNHVVENAQIVKVTLSDGGEYSAAVIGKDAKTDIAVLKINDAKNLTVAVIGDSDKLQVGEIAIAIGNPLGTQLTGTVTQGVISAVNRTVEASTNTYVNLIQTDAAINAGNSGGALVNGYGEVIGINTIKYAASGVEGIGFAIPVNDAMPIVQDLIKNGYVTGRPLIGVSLIEVTEQLAYRNNLPQGLYVANVEPSSSAEEGGIKMGDVIVKAEGKAVTTVNALNAIRDTKKVGDSLELEVYRNGKNIKLTLHLKEDKTQVPTKITE
ncbi:MAG: trypsin-like peptidase domain-containing protein [Bacillota bacterium]|nr:trypsin-like peptidase domain-containing protein [Bacillota bacterium]